MSNRLNAFHMRFIYRSVCCNWRIGPYIWVSVHNGSVWSACGWLSKSTDSNSIYTDYVTVISCALKLSSGITNRQVLFETLPARLLLMDNSYGLPEKLNHFITHTRRPSDLCAGAGFVGHHFITCNSIFM